VETETVSAEMKAIVGDNTISKNDLVSYQKGMQ